MADALWSGAPPREVGRSAGRDVAFIAAGAVSLGSRRAVERVALSCSSYLRWALSERRLLARANDRLPQHERAGSVPPRTRPSSCRTRGPVPELGGSFLASRPGSNSRERRSGAELHVKSSGSVVATISTWPSRSGWVKPRRHGSCQGARAAAAPPTIGFSGPGKLLLLLHLLAVEIEALLAAGWVRNIRGLAKVDPGAWSPSGRGPFRNARRRRRSRETRRAGGWSDCQASQRYAGPSATTENVNARRSERAGTPSEVASTGGPSRVGRVECWVWR